MFNIRNIVCLFLLFFLSSGISEAKTVKFALLSDIHYSTNEDNIEHSSRNWGKSKIILDGTIETINMSDLNFVMLLGDNIDSSQEKELISFLKKIKKINKPYYFCLGNHDAYKISGVSKETYAKLVNKYNKYKKYDSFNYTFSVSSEILGVVVDGSFPVAPNSHGVITKKTMAWIDKVLSENEDKKVIIFEHFPIKEPYEKKTHTIVNKEAYENMLKKHSNVIAICSGHYHEEKIFEDENGIYHISAPSLGVSHKFQAVRIEYDTKPFKGIYDLDIKALTVNFLQAAPSQELKSFKEGVKPTEDESSEEEPSSTDSLE